VPEVNRIERPAEQADAHGAIVGRAESSRPTPVFLCVFGIRVEGIAQATGNGSG
jgi:hypothetical protein